MAWLAIALATASTAEASEVGRNRPFGLGLIFGYPTGAGLSGKLYLGGDRQAIDMAVSSWGYYHGYGGVYAHVDYLWHPSVLAHGSVDVPWHVGIGGVLTSGGYYGYHDYYYGSGDVGLGARVPIGIDVNLNSVPLQFFADLALNVFLFPGTGADASLTLGGRYYF